MEPTQSIAARCEVELDIFSGMPNPTWMLSNSDAERFAKQVAALPTIPARELSGNLGYRGFIVRCLQGADNESIRIQRGVVQISKGEVTRYAADHNRELERQLFNAGKPHLTSEILQVVEREVS